MGSLSQDLDFDLFGDVEDTVDVSNEAPAPELDSSITEEVVEEPTAPEEVAPIEEPVDEPEAVKEDVPEADTNTEEELDIDSILKELLESTEDVDDKVEEVKDVAASTGNEELLGLIDELQTLLAEKNQQIAELNKKDEITSGRLMDTYGDAENYSFYKGTIDKLEGNPQLMMLVKNFDNDNEKAKERVVSILSDLIFEKTGEDVSSLINTNQKNRVSNALTDVDGGWDSSTPSNEKEADFTREESLTSLF